VKIPFLIVVAVTGLALTVAVPDFGGSGEQRTQARPEGATSPVPCDTLSAHPCTLVVQPGPATRVDRGHLGALSAPRELHGAYRYHQEQEHRVLYVYDDVGNLVGRVVDPEAVMLREPLQ